MFFNIIIPTFNSINTINKCINSILTQTFSDFIITVVDDMSQDDTVELIKDIQKYDKRINIVDNNEKIDAGGCRNKGFVNSLKTQYTLFIDSDDYYCSNKCLQMMYDFIKNNDFPDLIKCAYIERHKNYQQKRTFSSQTRRDLVWTPPAPWLSCVKSNMLQKFVEKRRRANDVVWYLRQCDKIKSFKVFNEPMVVYNVLTENSSWQGKVDDRKKAADFYIIGDLLQEKFIHSEINERKEYFIEKFKYEIKKYL